VKAAIKFNRQKLIADIEDYPGMGTSLGATFVVVSVCLLSLQSISRNPKGGRGMIKHVFLSEEEPARFKTRSARFKYEYIHRDIVLRAMVSLLLETGQCSTATQVESVLDRELEGDDEVN